jgi:hypothetical protein
MVTQQGQQLAGSTLADMPADTYIHVAHVAMIAGTSSGANHQPSLSKKFSSTLGGRKKGHYGSL